MNGTITERLYRSCLTGRVRLCGLLLTRVARRHSSRAWEGWTSVRKVKEGETTNDLFCFLTTEPNAEVRAIHPEAMPATEAEIEMLLTRRPTMC
jgi:hypothetical protein